jgi:hypothetical protein
MFGQNERPGLVFDTRLIGLINSDGRLDKLPSLFIKPMRRASNTRPRRSFFLLL